MSIINTHLVFIVTYLVFVVIETGQKAYSFIIDRYQVSRTCKYLIIFGCEISNFLCLEFNQNKTVGDSNTSR